MYSVFAMISAYERSTSPRPVSTGQPGWTQETRPRPRRGPRRRCPGASQSAGERLEVAALQRLVEGGVGVFDLLDVGVRCAHRAPSAAGRRGAGGVSAAPSTARATRTASAVARTSWTRTAQAPCVGRDRGDGGGGGVAFAGGRRARPRRRPGRGPGTACGRRRPAGGGRGARSAVEVGEEREVVRGVLGEAEAGVDDDPVGGDAAVDRRPPRVRAARRRLRRRRPRTRPGRSRPPGSRASA